MGNHIPNEWSNVQTIHVKLTSSIALPIYKATLHLSTNKETQTEEKEEMEDDKKTKEEKEKKSNNPIIKALDQMKGGKDGSSTKNKKRKMKKDDKDVDATPVLQQEAKKTKKEDGTK